MADISSNVHLKARTDSCMVLPEGNLGTVALMLFITKIDCQISNKRKMTASLGRANISVFL